jgi:hypothetical protein
MMKMMMMNMMIFCVSNMIIAGLNNNDDVSVADVLLLHSSSTPDVECPTMYGWIEV